MTRSKSIYLLSMNQTACEAELNGIFQVSQIGISETGEEKPFDSEEG